jgi:hypothetical protein
MRFVDTYNICDLKWDLKNHRNGTTVTAEKRRANTLRFVMFTGTHFLIRSALVKSTAGNDCHQQYINR